MATPATALLMQSNATARHGTAANLRSLGYEVSECGDECHLYAQAMRLAIRPGPEGKAFLILAEPTGDVVRDLETLRGARWPTPLVLVGKDADADVARHLHAACLDCERPTAEQLREAIATALAA